MLTLKERKIETAEDTSPNWVLTNIQTQTAVVSPMSQHTLSPSLEKVPAAHPLSG